MSYTIDKSVSVYITPLIGDWPAEAVIAQYTCGSGELFDIEVLVIGVNTASNSIIFHKRNKIVNVGGTLTKLLSDVDITTDYLDVFYTVGYSISLDTSSSNTLSIILSEPADDSITWTTEITVRKCNTPT